MVHPIPQIDITFPALPRVSEEALWANMLLLKLVQVGEACLPGQQRGTCPTPGAHRRREAKVQSDVPVQ